MGIRTRAEINEAVISARILSMPYQQLAKERIEILRIQGCTAEDWNLVTVMDARIVLIIVKRGDQGEIFNNSVCEFPANQSLIAELSKIYALTPAKPILMPSFNVK